ncbi:MAG: tetratricopeptide repeat protein [Saprospiraceae bacterium]|nr:tetratricopeptide repeat protein [Saprospiraceae bacterium]
MAFRGVEAAKKQDWETAIPLLEQEVAQAPSNEVAWTELARAYLQINQMAKAKDAAERALAIEPENLQAVNLLGLYYLRSNQIAVAQDVFTKIVGF